MNEPCVRARPRWATPAPAPPPNPSLPRSRAPPHTAAPPAGWCRRRRAPGRSPGSGCGGRSGPPGDCEDAGRGKGRPERTLPARASLVAPELLWHRVLATYVQPRAAGSVRQLIGPASGAPDSVHPVPHCRGRPCSRATTENRRARNHCNTRGDLGGPRRRCQVPQRTGALCPEPTERHRAPQVDPPPPLDAHTPTRAVQRGAQHANRLRAAVVFLSRMPLTRRERT